MDKEKRIKSERLKLNKIFAACDGNKKKLITNLIERASFLKIALEDLEETIKTEGVLDVFEQGDYSYNREHPALKSYNTSIKNYTNIIKQLAELVPEKRAQSKLDELMKL